MLQFIRSKAGSFIVKILFVLLIACFGLWGVGDFLRQTPADATIIRVGSTKIPANDVQVAVQRGIDSMKPLFGGNLDRAQAKQLGIIDRAVDGLVSRALFDQEAGHLGLAVGDGQISRMIASDPNFRGKDGHFDRHVFDGLLDANKLSEDDYVAMVRRELPRQDLVGVVMDNAIAPVTLDKLLFRKRAEKRVVDYIFLPISGIATPATPDDKILKAYYQNNIGSFTSPEFRGITLVTLTTDDVKAAAVPDDKLQDLYQQNLDEFSQDETRDISHILLPDQGTANLAHKALMGGKSVDEVARTIAKQDPDTVKLGWISRKDLPTHLATAAFSAPANSVTAPIKTEFGWSILAIGQIKPPHVESFEEARPRLIHEANAAGASDALYELSNKVEDAVAAGADLGAITQQFGLKQVVVKSLDSTGRTPARDLVTDLPVDTDSLVHVAFQTPQGQLGAVTQTKDGKFFLLRVDSITPPAARPFDLARSDVLTAWTATERARLLDLRSKALAGSISPSLSLATIGVNQHLTLGTTPAFTRDDSETASPVPPSLIPQIFSLNQGQSATAAGNNAGVDGQFVIQLREIQTPDPETDPLGVSSLGQDVTKQLSGEILEAFDKSLRTRFPVEIDRAKLDTLF